MIGTKLSTWIHHKFIIIYCLLKKLYIVYILKNQTWSILATRVCSHYLYVHITFVNFQNVYIAIKKSSESQLLESWEICTIVQLVVRGLLFLKAT